MAAKQCDPSKFYFDNAGNVFYKSKPNFQTGLASTNTDCTIEGIAWRSEVTTGATTTLVAEESGICMIATLGSGTQTFTLPLASALAGGFYTFVCGHASGEILVNPAGTNLFVIKASEAGASVVTSAGTGIKNTAATNIKGDRITVMSDGISSWYATMQSGIWATQ